jgi:hypothetical protein
LLRNPNKQFGQNQESNTNMPYNISTIEAAINTGGGLARQNRYLVFIYGNFYLPNFYRAARLTALVQGTELPGKAFMTTPRHTYGPPRKMPYLTQYNDINMTFLCTANMEERYFFDSWQNTIANVNSGYFNYYDDYVASIVMLQFSEDGIVTYAMRLEEAYPVTIPEQQMSYNENDSVMTLNVTFAYHKWRNLHQAFDDTGSGTGKGLAFDVDYEAPLLEARGGKLDGPYWKPTLAGKETDNILGIGGPAERDNPWTVPSNPGSAGAGARSAADGISENIGTDLETVKLGAKVK